jgi:hypothetical protein
MDATKVVTSLLTIGFIFAAVTIALKNPSAASAVIAAPVTATNGVLNALEGKPVNG